MMEQKERSIGHKVLLVGVPLLALYLFYQFNVVKLFNEGFTGHELMDLDEVKKLFRYHTFGLYVAFEVKHLVGYIMLCGFVLLAASEAFLVGRFLNVVRIVGGLYCLAGICLSSLWRLTAFAERVSGLLFFCCYSISAWLMLHCLMKVKSRLKTG